jgi:hypothetical protein
MFQLKQLPSGGGVVQAMPLTADIAVHKEPGQESTYAAHIPLYLQMFRIIYFQADHQPEVGDWIVRDPGAPSFHVPASFFGTDT